MREGKIKAGLILAIFAMLLATLSMAHPIQDYYKKYKNDTDMEARIVPPKMAAMLIDKEDYPEAIDLLKSMSALKYMSYYGEQNKVKDYATKALSSKGNYELLMEENTGYKNISVFGTKKRGTVRKIMAVVETKSQFLLLIGKGKLTEQHIRSLPDLSKEI